MRNSTDRRIKVRIQQCRTAPQNTEAHARRWEVGAPEVAPQQSYAQHWSGCCLGQPESPCLPSMASAPIYGSAAPSSRPYASPVPAPSVQHPAEPAVLRHPPPRHPPRGRRVYLLTGQYFLSTCRCLCRPQLPCCPRTSRCHAHQRWLMTKILAWPLHHEMTLWRCPSALREAAVWRHQGWEA